MKQTIGENFVAIMSLVVLFRPPPNNGIIFKKLWRQTVLHNSGSLFVNNPPNVCLVKTRQM
jgi:hypothetical protein